MMKKGKIIILSGPSGSGKTTLYKKLLTNPKFSKVLKRSISVTTRNKREGERHGKDYIFVSKKMFLYKKKSGHFLESMKVFDNYYGTPNKNIREALEKGQNILLAIDVQGAKAVCRKYKKAVTVFIKTPTFEDLRKRLTKRGSENEKILNLRVNTAKKELKEAKNYKHVIVNGNLASAFKELKEIIAEEVA